MTLPGGKRWLGEKSRDTVNRKVQEELGLDVSRSREIKTFLTEEGKARIFILDYKV
jgi:ADP-ribose pyrophosphatase YjhB (NUDIX family)